MEIENVTLKIEGKVTVAETKPTYDVTLYFENAIAHPGEKVNIRGIRTTLTPAEVFGVLQKEGAPYSVFLPGAHDNHGLVILERPRYAEIVPTPVTDTN